jgi:RimJ/RimL family protein N-acetyltransferase
MAMENPRTWIEALALAFGARTAYECAMASAQGRYLGGCGKIDVVNHRANLGARVRSSAAGRGVATVAVRRWLLGEFWSIRWLARAFSRP